MPNNEDVTTRLKVDITDLKKSMQEAKQATALAKSEFNEAASSCDDWSKSSDALGSKLNSLKATLNEQKTKLSLLNKEYELACAEQGETSAAAQRLQVQINNQQAAVNRTQKSINGYEQELSEVQEAEKKAAKTGKDVSDVLDEMRQEAEEASDGFTVFKGAIATFAGNVLTGFASAIKDGISNIINLAEETREYRNEMAKLDTAFSTNGHSADAANKTYQDLYAVLGDEGQAVEAANFMAKLTSSEEELANWTKIATGVYGTFGASLPIEGLAEAANETAKVGQVTGPLADALNWAGVSEDKFNESLSKCSNEQERQKLIMDTLNGLYSDAATKFEETNASVMDANRANANYQATLATLGEKIEPITTKVKEGFNGILTKILELVEGVDMSAFTAKIEEAFKVLTDTVLPAIVDGFQWILDNKDTLIAGLAGIAAGFVAFKVASLINSVVSAFQAFKTAQEGATVAQWLLNLAMNANPIMLIVTAVAAIVGALVAFIATNDNVRAKFSEVWDGICKFFTDTIPQVFSNVINWIKENWDTLLTFLINPFAGLFKYFYENNTKFKEFVDNAIKFIKELPGKVWTWLVNTINKIVTWRQNMIDKAKEVALGFIEKVVEFFKQLPGKVWTWLVNVVSKVGEWGSNLVAKGKEAAGNLLTTIVEKVKEIPGKMLSIGKDIVTGLWDGIGNAVDWLKSKIKGFVGNVTDWLKEFFKIGSPSKLMRDEVGKWLPRGIAEGVRLNAKYAIASVEKMSEAMLDSEKFYLAEKERLEKDAANKSSETTKKYLESLKTTAENERKEYDALIEDLKGKLEEIKDLQDGFSSSLFDETTQAFKKVKFNFGDIVEEMAVLPDTSAQIEQLTAYGDMLDELTAKRGDLPSAIANLLADMDMAEGMQYMQAMLRATDDEWKNYVESFEKRDSIAKKLAEVLFPAEKLSELQEIAKDMKETAATLVEGAKEFKQSFEGALGDASAGTSLLSGAGHLGGGVVNNFTQNNYSPKALDRLTIYRQGKNLLNYAAGGR